MTREELDILLLPEVRRAVEENIDRDPVATALDRRVPHAREVATQVKYLARARTKLPHMWASRCIIPPRAFEQSSSEECAAAKHIEGDTLLDLTCGLGVDAAAHARRFGRVVTLERDEVLAEAVRENMRRMGISNVEVVTASAEEYLKDCRERFDWIYVDPDRRNAESRRVVRLEDCSPDITALRGEVERVSDRLAVKCSPLFDVDEALRIFGRCGVEAVSLHGECKEVMVYADGREPRLAAEAVGRGRFEASPSEAQQARLRMKALTESHAAQITTDAYRYLIIPDVALQKARLTACHLQGMADMWSETSFAFAAEEIDPASVLGRIEPIESITPYDPKALRRELRGQGVDILCRDFPYSPEQVRKAAAMRSGDRYRIALTRIDGRCMTIRLRTIE